MIGNAVSVVYTDARFTRLTRNNNSRAKPEYRLPLIVLSGYVQLRDCFN